MVKIKDHFVYSQSTRFDVNNGQPLAPSLSLFLTGENSKLI